jgi:hypothetical protein
MARPNLMIPRDAVIKSELKVAIQLHLYAPFYERMEKTLNQLIMRNAVVQRYSHMSFTYKGVEYVNDNIRPPLRRNRLHAEFFQEMDRYLADVYEVENVEQPLVMGFVTKVLNLCSDDLCDITKIFPESLHPALYRVLSTWHPAGNVTDPEAIKGWLAQPKQQEDILRMKCRMATNLLY